MPSQQRNVMTGQQVSPKIWLTTGKLPLSELRLRASSHGVTLCDIVIKHQTGTGQELLRIALHQPKEGNDFICCGIEGSP